MSAPTLNGIRALSVKLLIPWRGAWIADVQLDPDDVMTAPSSGPATLLVAGSTLTGTIDPRGAGSFGGMASVRVVAGAGGWDKPVPPQHYHLDNGVSTTSVYTGAASLVGETIVESAPSLLGVDVMRSAGPASRVFQDSDWYVDFGGLTQVGSRPAAVADASMQLMTWDAVQQRAELVSDVLVLPGTALSDVRLNGVTPTIRDVEQTYDRDGSRVVAWCAVTPVGRLLGALTNMVRELGRTATLKVYQYRIALEGSDGRLQLQAVSPTAGMPSTLPLSVWPGMQGDSGTYQLGGLVLVHFVEGPGGAPPQPVVLGFDPTAKPIKRVLDASAEVDVGPSAVLVAIAGGTVPLTPTPWATETAAALTAFAASLSTASVGPLAPLGALATALTSALGALPPAATTKTVAA